MGRRKKPINRTNIPQYQVEAIARCLLPDILAFFESEEGQREFAQSRKHLLLNILRTVETLREQQRMRDTQKRELLSQDPRM